MLFFVRRLAGSVAFLALAAGCTTPSEAPPPRTVESTAANALRNLPGTANNHAVAAALAWYVHAAYQPATHLTPAGPETLVNGTQLDPMGAAALFGAMLTLQDIGFRTHVFTGVPGYGWYPVLEVLDDDGDHAWDPYAGRFVADYDKTPKSLVAALQSRDAVAGGLGVAPADVLTAFTADAGTAGVPFAKLPRYARLELDAKRAAVATHEVSGDWRVGTADGSAGDIEAAGVLDGDYRPALAYAGTTTAPIAPHNLAHRLRLVNLAPGATYRVRITTVGDDAARLITVPDGLTLVTQNRTAREYAAEYAAKGTEASFSVGVRLPYRVSFDAWEWSRP